MEEKEEKEEKHRTALNTLRNHMDIHGLFDWKTDLFNSTTTLGYCDYSIKTISLCKILVETCTEKEILDTILHEIAHALCPDHGHDEVWSKKAIEIGSDGETCGDVFFKLKYNFMCEKGCKISYLYNCKSVRIIQFSNKSPIYRIRHRKRYGRIQYKRKCKPKQKIPYVVGCRGCRKHKCMYKPMK